MMCQLCRWNQLERARPELTRHDLRLMREPERFRSDTGFVERVVRDDLPASFGECYRTIELARNFLTDTVPTIGIPVCLMQPVAEYRAFHSHDAGYVGHEHNQRCVSDGRQRFIEADIRL